MKNFLTYLLVLVVGIALKAQTHWNFADDFSNIQGASNWYVFEHWGYYQGKEMYFDTNNNKWIGSEQYLSVTPTIMHPGNTKDVMIKWIAPFDTRITISGSVNKTSSGGDGVKFYITTDVANDWHIPLLEYDISGSDLSVKTINRSIWVNKGDAIFFFVNKKDNLSFDSIHMDLNIDTEEFIDIPWTDVDHSNPAITGSIAWYIATYGNQKTYRLSTDSVYIISDYLELPERVSLISASNTGYAKIQYQQNDIDAPETAYREQMLLMNDETSIKGLDLNAKAVSQLLLRATNKKYIRIENSYLHNTRNNFKTFSTSPRPHIIYFAGSQYSIIKNNIIENAGIYSTPGEDPKIYPDLWPEQGRSEGVMASNNHYTAIVGNTIRNVLGHGILIELNSHYLIDGNTIENTGLNWLYSGYSNYDGNNVGDGIGGYHHETLTDLWFTIRNNTINHSMNHGIHVGGNYITIENNHVRNTDNIGIFLDDWRTPTSYSSYCRISNNDVDSSNLVGATYTHDIYIGWGCHRTNSVFNNIVSSGSYSLWIAPEKDYCDETPAAQIPVSNFFGLPDTVCIGDEVSFFDLSENNPTEWLWDFGDGIDTCNLQNPHHIYNSEGIYNVSLTTSNTAGSNNITQTNCITVIQPAIIITQPTDVYAQQGDNVSFSVAADGQNLDYIWYHNNVAISVANSNTLNLSNINISDAGTYFVEIISPCNTIFSDTVILDITTTNIEYPNNYFFKISTNPAKNYLQIEFINNQQDKNIQILDVTGKIVKTAIVTNGIKKQLVNISNLQAGIYFIKVENKIKKFIKK